MDNNRSTVVLLEDKELIGLNKVHKNVLKAAPTVYTNKVKTISAYFSKKF